MMAREKDMAVTWISEPYLHQLLVFAATPLAVSFS
jgi:prophage antirepressor-like protein